MWEGGRVGGVVGEEEDIAGREGMRVGEDCGFEFTEFFEL